MKTTKRKGSEVNRPIETRAIGEVVATSLEIRRISPGFVSIVFCFDEWGRRYERVRVLMAEPALAEELAFACSQRRSHLH